MKIMSFDLSSSCIGVICADVNSQNEVVNIMSAPIIPPKFNPEELGFKRYKEKLQKNGQSITSWVKPGENWVSPNEKKHRDAAVRSRKDVFVLQYISQKINDLVSAIKPELVLVEKNEIFNGVLTSVLLGKIMGVLHGVCGALGIPVEEYKVQQIRKPYNVMKLVLEFSKNKSPEALRRIPDLSKAAIRNMLSFKYPHICFETDDESDACLVFDYWLNYVRRRNDNAYDQNKS